VLKIQNLHVSIGEKKILKGISLDVKPGEIHAIMGPNGSGKSTLSNVLAGKENYTIESGTIDYQGKNLLELSVEQRAAQGVFMSFQYPVALPGVRNSVFLRASLNSIRKQQGLPELDGVAFLKIMKEKAALVKMNPELLNRSVNEGFSGGEKKRNEILQMAILDPKLAILDETDSGLDIDALRIVAEGVNSLRSPKRSMIVITHYQRLLDYIVPDVVHVLYNGQIIKSGGKELAHELEAKGYGWLTGENTTQALPTI
jgi:Fe-S cluster assembly ATP-binding protein